MPPTRQPLLCPWTDAGLDAHDGKMSRLDGRPQRRRQTVPAVPRLTGLKRHVALDREDARNVSAGRCGSHLCRIPPGIRTCAALRTRRARESTQHAHDGHTSPRTTTHRARNEHRRTRSREPMFTRRGPRRRTLPARPSNSRAAVQATSAEARSPAPRSTGATTAGGFASSDRKTTTASPDSPGTSVSTSSIPRLPRTRTSTTEYLSGCQSPGATDDMYGQRRTPNAP